MATETAIVHGLTILLLGTAIGWTQQKVGSLIPASQFGSPNAIQKPVLFKRGGMLVFSDSPEQITDGAPIPGAFYRDKTSGIFRIFYHHQNVTANDVSVGIAITNTSNRTEALFSHGRGASVSYYPDVAGQVAFSAFLSSHHETSFVAILNPGETYYSTQDNAAGDTASGFEEYLLVAFEDRLKPTALPLALLDALSDKALADRTPAEIISSLPREFAAGTATVTTLVYAGTRPVTPTALPILAGDDHIRGTFAHFDRLGTFTVAASAGLQALAVSTASPGLAYSDDMPGEYELGVDAVDSGKQVYNDGNYGILYKFLIRVDNQTSFASSPFGILMQPTGGAGEYVIALDGHTLASPYVDYTSAWWVGQLTSRAKATTITLETSLPGGAAGPQQLLFAPHFTGQ